MPEAAGSTLAHYRLIERIGEGGMGVVWRAQDTHLDRDVAVKILARGAVAERVERERFRREAQVLSRLSHPGIATVHDFGSEAGTEFIVMEWVPGGTLDRLIRNGPIPTARLVQLATEIADALASAHAAGILHRDLKPGNIALAASGSAKLLDFGIARWLDTAGTRSAITQPGQAPGSLPYMAPEQILGEAEDERTDLYALGVTLHELAAGVRPFQRERPEALMFEILNTAPPPVRTVRPDIPAELDRLIGACLGKSRADRPSSSREVCEALRRMSRSWSTGEASESPPSPEAIRSIAVLPLENLSKDPEQEYFADGLTEALISELAGIRALRVISMTSVMRYKGAARALPEIARELNVDAVLEGSALLLGDRVRIRVRLVSARTDETRWSERYDRGLEDVLGLQSEVAETVAREIAIQVTPREASKLARRSAVVVEAHGEFLKGRHLLAAGSPQAVVLAMRHFRSALEADASFAPAWAGLAEAHIIRASRGMAPPAQARAEAASAAERALGLDDTLADAHAALGAVRGYERAFDAAVESFRRAIELNPGLTSARYGIGRVYYCTERHGDAQREMLHALSLDPLSMLIHTTVGDAYYYAREYEKSVIYYRMAIELDPRFDGAHTDLARSLEALGRFDEARAEYEEGRRLSGGVAGPSFGLAHLAASSGDFAEARRMLGELTAARSQRVVSAWGIAALHASLGDVDAAFEWLEIAVREQATGLVFLRVHPRLDAIRGDARYAPLLARVGLG